MNLKQLEKKLQNFPKFRLTQAKQAVFKSLIDNWDKSILPKELKEALKIDCPLEIKVENHEHDKDGTEKAVLSFDDGKSVETVLMRHKDGRNTICVSSQAGCPMNCDFCATGKMGFKRNLTSYEILNQVLYWARKLKKGNEKISNIVFMGMGEPFMNFEEVKKAIKIFNTELEIGARNISISTCGLPQGIRELAKFPLQINLAISLHAPNDTLRSQLMPINTKYNLKKLLIEVANYINKTNRRVMIEYVLIDRVNDSEKNAKELAQALKTYLPKLFFVNLIPFNPTQKYKSSSSQAIKKFKNILARAGIETIERQRFGRNMNAACGQLATKK